METEINNPAIRKKSGNFLVWIMIIVGIVFTITLFLETRQIENQGIICREFWESDQKYCRAAYDYCQGIDVIPNELPSNFSVGNWQTS